MKVEINKLSNWIKRGLISYQDISPPQTRSKFPFPSPINLKDKMNKTERTFQFLLKKAQEHGIIYRWGYEEIKFCIGKKSYYTPDFLVVTHNGAWILIEIKGFLRDDALIKFKSAADKYPEHSWIMLRKERERGFSPLYLFYSEKNPPEIPGLNNTTRPFHISNITNFNPYA